MFIGVLIVMVESQRLLRASIKSFGLKSYRFAADIFIISWSDRENLYTPLSEMTTFKPLFVLESGTFPVKALLAGDKSITRFTGS